MCEHDGKEIVHIDSLEVNAQRAQFSTAQMIYREESGERDGRRGRVRKGRERERERNHLHKFELNSKAYTEIDSYRNFSK